MHTNDTLKNSGDYSSLTVQAKRNSDLCHPTLERLQSELGSPEFIFSMAGGDIVTACMTPNSGKL